MRPAFSVIFLTTLIGAGQGLFLALVAGQFYWVIGAIDTQETPVFYAFGSLLALALLSAGLFSSFFHLAHPERAWRSAAAWRTSWLSREIIILPMVMGVIAVYGGLHWFDWHPVVIAFGNMKNLDLSMTVGYLGAASVITLFICTGMIYACMKFIQEWASPLTVLNFTLMGSASGFILATAYAGVMDSALWGFYAAMSLLLTLFALLGKLAGRMRNQRLKPRSTVQTAIGMHHPNIRQISRGFTASAFNLKEFFHPGNPGLLPVLRWAYFITAFGLPILIMMLGLQFNSTPLFVLAFAVQYTGLIAERWMFFAEARHPQNLYYQNAD